MSKVIFVGKHCHVIAEEGTGYLKFMYLRDKGISAQLLWGRVGKKFRPGFDGFWTKFGITPSALEIVKLPASPWARQRIADTRPKSGAVGESAVFKDVLDLMGQQNLPPLDRALYALLRDNQERMVSMDEDFHARFRTTGVTGNPNTDEAIFYLLHKTQRFWDIVHWLRRDKVKDFRIKD